MIVIDDNNLKLLKMNEKLLEMSEVKSEEVLNEYKKLATEIDRQVYNQMVNKIENNNNYDLKPLEEQLKFLSELEEDYTYINELQHKFQNTYKEYANKDLTLSNLNNILITEIKDRINSISGYLINLKNIERNNEELDKLNSLLIDEEKKKNLLKERLNNLEDKLEEKLLKAEGRIYDKNDKAIYTSAANELKLQLFEILGDNVKNSEKLDLKTLLADEVLLKQELSKAIKNKKDLEESLEAAKICYDNTESINNKEIYESINIETNKARYKYILLTIIELIANRQEEYDLVKEKREKIIELLDYRNKYISDLNIKYLYDPFERIGIKEQIDELNRLGNNDNFIKNIRKDISELSMKNDEMEKNNNELVKIINNKITLIQDDTKFIDIKSNNNIFNADIEKTSKVLDNQVIKIHDIGNDFKTDRVDEKTRGVIHRVNEMLINDFIKDDEGIAPELLIENDNSFDYSDIWSSSNISNDFDFELPNKNVENINNKENDIAKEEASTEETLSSNLPKDNQRINEEDSNLFSEVVPFETTPLFSEKTDDGIFDDRITKAMKPQTLVINLNNENKNNEFTTKINENNDVTNLEDDTEMTMPDVFWPTQEDELEEQNTKIKKLTT